jgi:uncharacterized protein
VTWQFVLTGLTVGTLVGFTGMGGGSLMTPALVLLFGFPPTTAVGTDIVHGAIFKTVGALRHRKLGTVHARLSGWMFAASAPTSLAGVALATWIEHRYGSGAQSVGAIVLGCALLLGSVGLLAKGLLGGREPAPAGNFTFTRRDRFSALAIGFFGGFVVGLTSVGTGVFFGLTMLIVFPLRSSKVVGTDIVHGAALLWVAGIGHMVAGNVDLRTVGWLLVGSIPGVLAGSQLTVRVSDEMLRNLLATVLAASGIKLAGPPHANLLLLVAVGVGVCLMLRMATIKIRRRSLGTQTRRAFPVNAELVFASQPGVSQTVTSSARRDAFETRTPQPPYDFGP